MMKSELKGGSMSAAVNCAQGSRTAPAGSYKGGKPPSGPKPEPQKLNGVPAIKTGGTSR